MFSQEFGGGAEAFREGEGSAFTLHEMTGQVIVVCVASQGWTEDQAIVGIDCDQVTVEGFVEFGGKAEAVAGLSR